MTLPSAARIAIVLALFNSGAMAAAPPATPRIEESIATDVNTAGDIVGETRDTANVRRAVVSRQGRVTELGTLGGSDSFATAINEAGVIIGAAQTAAAEWHGFVWRPGAGMRDLGTLGGRGSHAVALGRNGHVVGYADTADDTYHAFVHDGTRMTDLGTLGGKNSYATAVNAHGHVVGAAHNANGYRRAFLYKPEAGMVELPGLGGRASAAMAINDRGMVVGAAETPDRRWHAFLFDGRKTIDLGAQVSAGDSFATGISRDGKIVGTIRANEFKSYTFVHDKGVTRILPNLAADRIVSKITEDGRFVGASNMGRRFHSGAIQTGEPSVELTEAQKFDRFMYSLLAVAFAAWVLWHVGTDLRARRLQRNARPRPVLYLV